MVRELSWSRKKCPWLFVCGTKVPRGRLDWCIEGPWLSRLMMIRHFLTSSSLSHSLNLSWPKTLAPASNPSGEPGQHQSKLLG